MYSAEGRKLSPAEQEELKKEYDTAVTLQCFVRIAMANIKVKARAMRAWRRVYDPEFDIYFWYNNINGQSQWHVPKYHVLFSDKDELGAQGMQRIIRGFVGRRRVKHKADSKWTRFFDAKLNRFYWMENDTQRTFWNATKWLVKQEIKMPPEDEQLFDQFQKIKALEDALEAKNQEIKEIRKATYEELEPAVILDRVASAKALKRDKHMDVWTTDELAAFFVDLKMDEHVQFLYQNRVDGMLFINLVDDDWPDMGITSRFQRRKLQLILKAFRFRYQKKKEKAEIDEDDELISEYTPSELSDIIAQEDISDDELSAPKTNDDDQTVDSDEVPIEETEEQRLEKLEDERNITIDLVVPGDNENFPMVGDIVRMRYVCYLKGGDKPIGSTKASMGRPSIEFVLGVNHIIKGIDRAMPLMSIGERSKIHVTSEYAYGTQGLFPLIPPNQDLTFDITLLGFRMRAKWVKPLIQEPGLSMKPYMDAGPVKVYGSQNDADDESKQKQ